MPFGVEPIVDGQCVCAPLRLDGAVIDADRQVDIEVTHELAHRLGILADIDQQQRHLALELALVTLHHRQLVLTLRAPGGHEVDPHRPVEVGRAHDAAVGQGDFEVGCPLADLEPDLRRGRLGRSCRRPGAGGRGRIARGSRNRWDRRRRRGRKRGLLAQRAGKEKDNQEAPDNQRGEHPDEIG